MPPGTCSAWLMSMPSSPQEAATRCCMQVVAEGGQQADIHAEQAHVVGNISSDAAETDAHAAGVGIPRDERRIGLAADIDVHAADDGGIGAGAEHIALPAM